MRMACDKWHVRGIATWLLGGVVLAWSGVAAAQQAGAPAPRPPVWVATPPPAVQFQQQMQQQQVRDQLQKRQLESSLRQAVSDQSRRDQADDALTRIQHEQADQARRDRERAAQQDLLKRQAATLSPDAQAVPAPATMRPR